MNAGNLYSTADLWRYYARFNEAYFGNSLPLPRRIDYVDDLPEELRGAVAFTSLQITGCARAYEILLLRPAFLGKDPRFVLLALLHEIVHVHVCEVDLEHAEGHGALFRSICRQLKEFGWNVDVTMECGAPAFALRNRNHDEEAGNRRTSGSLLNLLSHRKPKH